MDVKQPTERAVALSIRLPDGFERELRVGEQATFGRAAAEPGAAPDIVVASDNRVSLIHGSVGVSESHWWVTASGSFHGLTVFDIHSPSRIHVPKGCGPVIVPFPAAVVSIQVRGTRYTFTVDGPGPKGWVTDWTAMSDAGSGTQPAWERDRWFKKDSSPLAWFRVLVALCEPRLLSPPSDETPSNKELCQRLSITQHNLDKQLIILRARLGISGTFDERSRTTAVCLALHERLVTNDDLALLDLKVAPDLE